MDMRGLVVTPNTAASRERQNTPGEIQDLGVQGNRVVGRPRFERQSYVVSTVDRGLPPPAGRKITGDSLEGNGGASGQGPMTRSFTELSSVHKKAAVGEHIWVTHADTRPG